MSDVAELDGRAEESKQTPKKPRERRAAKIPPQTTPPPSSDLPPQQQQGENSNAADLEVMHWPSKVKHWLSDTAKDMPKEVPNLVVAHFVHDAIVALLVVVTGVVGFLWYVLSRVFFSTNVYWVGMNILIIAWAVLSYYYVQKGEEAKRRQRLCFIALIGLFIGAEVLTGFAMRPVNLSNKSISVARADPPPLSKHHQGSKKPGRPIHPHRLLIKGHALKMARISFNNGVGWSKQGLFDVAALSFAKAASLNPNNPDALSDQANSLEHAANQEDDQNKALIRYRQAISIRRVYIKRWPHRMAAHINLANDLRQTHQIDASRAEYKLIANSKDATEDEKADALDNLSGLPSQ